LLGDGDGGFTVGAPFSIAAMRPIPADVDLDGLPDLVSARNVVNDQGEVLVALQLGDGGVGNATSYDAGSGRGFTVTDFTGDGRPDIVAIDVGSYATLIDQPGGSFTPGPGVALAAAAWAVTGADMNGDGRADLVAVADREPAFIWVSLSLDGGALAPPFEIDGGVDPLAVTTADLNGDGLRDVVLANEYASYLSFFLGNGDGTLQSERKCAYTPSNVSFIVQAPFDPDGDLRDEMVASNTDELVLTGIDASGTCHQRTVSVPGLVLDAAVVVAKLDADGIQDVALAQKDQLNDDQVVILLSRCH